jgi:uncharacterized protein YodC (DUF2158 family)
MARKLVVGDVARLKSGGPWMTVVKDKLEVGSKFVGMAWFDGSALSNEVFPRDALEPDPARQAQDDAKDKTDAAPKAD